MNRIDRIADMVAADVEVKYPRTPHLPWSEGASEDDIQLINAEMFEGKNVVVTEKLDGENCLGEDTVITTQDGKKTIKWICDTKYAGKVLSYNVETGCEEWCVVQQWMIQPSCDDWYEIELENGVKIVATGNHYFWMPEYGCYRKVNSLIEGDELFDKKS